MATPLEQRIKKQIVKLSTLLKGYEEEASASLEKAYWAQDLYEVLDEALETAEEIMGEELGDIGEKWD